MRATLAAFLLLLSVPAGAAGLVGTWSGTLEGETLVLELRKDGSGRLDGEPVQYRQQGELLLIQIDGEVLAYTVAMQGKRMTLSGGDLEAPLVLTRGQGAAHAEAAAPTPAAPRGGVAQELVGKWCYINVHSSGYSGGAQAMRCFELTADGRYSYSGESSRSAYGDGYYGATASQSQDSGRWSATPDTLTAHSDSGSTSTYRLERRNHPKNRDPMLCLDGECYVTAWQRAPW